MYYEAIPQTEPITLDVTELATRLKSGEKSHITPFRYEHEGNFYLVVSDVSVNSSPFFESAIIREADMMQIESLTIGWIDTPEEVKQYLINSCTEPCNMGKADLIIGNPKNDDVASFECGCCGSYFKGNVKKQLAFGQDSGYGICQKCEDRFYK